MLSTVCQLDEFSESVGKIAMLELLRTIVSMHRWRGIFSAVNFRILVEFSKLGDVLS